MKNNALWVCRQSSTCHFSCYEKQSNKNLYTGAVEAFLNTGQSIPLCCIRKDGERNCSDHVTRAKPRTWTRRRACARDDM